MRGTFHAWTKAHRSEIPPLARLANDDQWEQVAEETRGATHLRALYYARSEAFAGRFAAIYGQSLEQVEAEWLAFADTFIR